MSKLPLLHRWITAGLLGGSGFVLVASPVDLGRLIKLPKRFLRVRYEVQETTGLSLRKIVEEFASGYSKSGTT